MAQVPYQPYPTAQPSQQGTPRIGVDTPGAAFGENIGRAVEGLGTSLERSGNELFTRAIALKELENETLARDADTRYMDTAGKLHADFSSKQGLNAGPEALNKYSSDLRSSYQDIRSSLPNDDARRRYDASALSVMSRSIFNGAGHSAQQMKVAADGSADANIRARFDSIFQNPKSDTEFNDAISSVTDSIRTKAGLWGWTGDKYNEQSKEMVSGAWSSRIIGTSRNQPQEALTMLEANRDKLTEKDFLKVDSAVRGQARAVGAANIANDVYNSNIDDEGNLKTTFKVLEQEARDKAEKLFPDDPIAANHAVATLHARYQHDQYAKKSEDNNNLQIVSDAIKRGVVDERQLRLDPDVARALDNLPKRKQLDIPGMINRYNASRDKTDHEANFYMLKGLSNNNVEEFLNTDLTKYDLSLSQIDKLGTIRAKLLKDTSGDPRVSKAIGWMRGAMGAQMEALGVFKRTDNNKEDYDHLTGTIQSGIETWIDNHKKPPTYDEFIKQIAPEVIKTRKEPAWFGLSTKEVPFFTQTVPDRWSEDFKKAVAARGLDEPTEEETYKAYVQSQLIKLYDKKKGTEVK